MILTYSCLAVSLVFLSLYIYYTAMGNPQMALYNGIAIIVLGWIAIIDTSRDVQTVENK